jgi:hypothetical protein
VDPASGTSGFVGRDTELAQLEGWLREATAGHGRVLALAGDPGIGKTRTVEELVARAQLPASQVLWGRCPEHEGAPAYWPWAQVISAWIERHDADTVRDVLRVGDGGLAELVPAVRAHLPARLAPVVDDPDQARFLLFDAVATFLRRAAAHAPLVVVLDDLHWADAASVQLLGFVAGEVRAMSLLLVATFRDVEMARVPGRLDAIGRLSQRLALRGLDAAQVEAFVRATAGVTPPDGLVAAIHRTAEGNPFFTGELVRVLRAEGGLVDAARGTGPITLPEEVRATVRRRLEPLSIDDRRLLSVAAVIGRDFDLGLLRTVVDLPMGKLLERLADASNAHLVDETPGVLGRFRFAHALIRQTLYDDLTAMMRANLHRQVAQALAATHHGGIDAPLAELAHHFYHAAPLGDALTAIDYAVAAAERAERLVAHEEAIGHVEHALELLALAPPDDVRRIELLLMLGLSAWRASDSARARTVFREAARRSQASGNVGGLIRSAIGLQQAGGFSGRVDAEMLGIVEQALAACDGDGNPFRPFLLMSLASILYFTDRHERCAALADETLVLARRLGDTNAIAGALLMRHLTLLGPGDPTERLALADEALAMPVDTLLRHSVMRGHVTRVLDLLELAEVVSAERHTEHFAQLADDWHLPAARWHVGVLRATLAQLAGRFDDAHHQAAEAMALRRDAQDPSIAQTFCLQRAMHLREVGGGSEHLEASLAAYADESPARATWASWLALLQVEAGRDAAARATLDALAVRGFTDVPRTVDLVPTLAVLAETVHRLGDTERAAMLEPLLQPFARRCAVVSTWVVGCLGSVERHLGLLAATMGRLDEAIAHHEVALAVHAQMGAPALGAHTQAELGRMLVTRNAPGDAARAAALLADARATAEALGMTRLRARFATTAPPVRPSADAVRAAMQREGEYWTIRFGDQAVRLKDTKGIHHLATLLRHPGHELHALDLAGGGDASPDTTPIADRGDAGELLDSAARAAYARRLDDLGAEVAEARRADDDDRALRAEREIEFLSRELSRGVGLGGRSRRAASASERARLNITRAIGRVIEKIAVDHPTLGQHLEATVRTGTFCSYTPDPRMPVTWDIRPEP